MSVLECKNLSIGFPEKTLIKDINFKFEKGQYLCIIGENGSGKSTLIKTILGLHKAVKGRVFFDRSNIHIGYIPQANDFQKDFPATVKEIVMSGFIGKMGMRPFYNKNEKLLAKAIMRDLNILDFEKRSYKELSGGQQQKVLLARAMCASSEFLVLDEPTNGLDAKSIKNLYKTISHLNQEHLMSIIMISHNLSAVFNDVTHVLYLKHNGYFYGTKEEFKKSEYAELYLEGGKE